MLKQARLTIHPQVSGFYWADFSSFDILVERGRVAALNSLKQLKKNSWWYRLRKRLFTSK